MVLAAGFLECFDVFIYAHEELAGAAGIGLERGDFEGVLGHIAAQRGPAGGGGRARAQEPGEESKREFHPAFGRAAAKGDG